MARNRNFSEPQALEAITNAFIENGFARTSLSLLEDATGIGKQSLYNTFGDKQKMYLMALADSVQRRAHVLSSMQKSKNGRAALEIFFDSLIDECTSTIPTRNRCIITSGLLEELNDDLLATTLQAQWTDGFELLRSMIERGQRDGSLRNTQCSAELAELLMALMGGLRVAVQAGRTPEQLRRLMDNALRIIIE